MYIFILSALPVLILILPMDCPSPNWTGSVVKCDPGAHDPAQYCPGAFPSSVYACPSTKQQKPHWVLCSDGVTWCDPYNPSLLCPPLKGQKEGAPCGSATPCVPKCGPCDNGTSDGCGGVCSNGCDSKTCGKSEKGCVCGTCPLGSECDVLTGKCSSCKPNCPPCSTKPRPDGCGGLCPAKSCPPGKRCNEETNECEPCVKKPCPPCSKIATDDGCGGTCPASRGCDGRVCGPSKDGCVSSCGTCSSGFVCENGQCVPCRKRPCPPCTTTPVDDGCGGLCPVMKGCDGRTCGPSLDGCISSCGSCPPGFACKDGKCVGCTKRPCPPCALTPISDGCGGTCPVAKGCGSRKCGPSSDGCVSDCGSCPTGFLCSANGECVADGDDPADPMRYRPSRHLIEFNADATPDKRIGNHAIVFVNSSGEDLYIGMISSQRRASPGTSGVMSLVDLGLEDLTGFLLPKGVTYLAYVPLGHSGRLWARSGCRWFFKPTNASIERSVDGLPECDVSRRSIGGLKGCAMACDTGSCGAGNAILSNYVCRTDGGEPPATLFEFTWGYTETDEDTWDVSNVDGHNIGIRVDVIGGTVKPGRSVACRINMPVESWCPKELTLKGKIVPGADHCNSICKAVTSWDPFANVSQPFFDQLSDDAKSIIMGYQTQTEPWTGGSMRDFLCCRCKEMTDGICMNAGTRKPQGDCPYGCSPYMIDPATSEFTHRRCFAKRVQFDPSYRQAHDGTTRQVGWSSVGTTKEEILSGKLRNVPDWPKAGPPANPGAWYNPERNYAEIYADLCPNAYSYQFADLSSTYQATNATGYRIEFLPRPGN